MIQITGYNIQDKKYKLILEGSEMNVTFHDFKRIDFFMKETAGKVFNSDDDLRLYISEFAIKNDGKRITISKVLLNRRIDYLKAKQESFNEVLESNVLTENERNFYFEKIKEINAELKGLNWVLENRDLYKCFSEDK